MLFQINQKNGKNRMAIYHCTTKPISRASGRSATASSAYRAGEKIIDQRTGEIHDYTKKQGVEYTEIISNLDYPLSRSEVWNTSEMVETRKNSRVSREFIIALPNELNSDQRKDLAKEFTQYLVDKYSVVADLAVHAPNKEGDDRNHHAHIMMTTRKALMIEDELKLTDKSDLELSNTQRKDRGLCVTQDEIKKIRETWANMTNRSLELSGSKERIDHRSFENQSVDLQPTVHEGPKVTQLRRKGIDTEISRHNDQVRSNNENQMRLSPLNMDQILHKSSELTESKYQAWQEEQEAKKRAQIERQQQERKLQEVQKKERSKNHDRGFSR